MNGTGDPLLRSSSTLHIQHLAWGLVVAVPLLPLGKPQTDAMRQYAVFLATKAWARILYVMAIAPCPRCYSGAGLQTWRKPAKLP